MGSRRRTQREDYLEDLRKMERRLKDEDPGPKPALDLQTVKYNIAYAELGLLEVEHSLAKERANMDDVAIKEREDEIAQTRKFHAHVEAEYETALKKLEVAHESKSTYPTTTPIEMEKMQEPSMVWPDLFDLPPPPLRPLSEYTRAELRQACAAQKEREMSPEDAQLYESMKCFRRWTRTSFNRLKPRRSRVLRDTRRWVMETEALEDFRTE